MTSLACFYLTYLLFEAGVNLFGFDYIYNIAAFPLLAVGLILMPIRNGYLRLLEKRVDMFALGRIQNKQSFVSAITKLGEQNLSDPSPGRLVELLLYTHPPISKRLRFAKEKSEEITDNL